MNIIKRYFIFIVLLSLIVWLVYTGWLSKAEIFHFLELAFNSLEKISL